MATLVRPGWALLALSLVTGCARAPARSVIEDGKVLVRCAGPAARVLAIGSFNDWGPGVALTRLPDGTFGAALAMPPGLTVVACERHAADGSVAAEAPLDAARVVDDGFGGRNGVYDAAPADPRGRESNALPVTSTSRARL